LIFRGEYCGEILSLTTKFALLLLVTLLYEPLILRTSCNSASLIKKKPPD
jgi:hypothetical protein